MLTIQLAVSGVSELGFSITVFPVNNAGASFLTTIAAGKTLVYNAELVKQINKNTTISIDADTGIITEI